MSVEKNYRPDIDGLRAIAVTSVILFHFGATIFPGGFVGVDVFFVISGYLITQIISREIEAGTFSYMRFYERRVRRIFPALIVVLIVTTFVAYQILLPQELKDFGQSLAATALFSSNILFWLEAGYFDAESNVKPLLHTWSLAVEEQYYVLFPLLMMIIYKYFSKYKITMLVLIWLFSLTISYWQTSINPEGAFFLIPGRVWELLTGSILALFCANRVEKIQYGGLIAAVGMAMLTYSVIFFNHGTAFPGLAALLPCLGTALLIYSGTSNTGIIGNILSCKPLALTGLLSYSLYLWHWPFYVYVKMYFDKNFSLTTLVSMYITLYIVSWLSWRYVESPFRNRRWFSFRTVSGLFFCLSIIAIVVGGLFHIKNGFLNRFGEGVQAMTMEIEQHHSFLPDRCLASRAPSEKPKSSLLCRFSKEKLDGDVLAREQNGESDSSHKIVLWGDSHAASMVPGFRVIEDIKGIEEFYFGGLQGCPPLLGVSVTQTVSRRNNACGRYTDYVLQELIDDDSVEIIILAAHWSLYANGTRWEADPNRGEVFLFELSKDEELTVDKNQAVLNRGLNNTIKSLLKANKQVIIVGPVPEIAINGLSSLARMEILGIERDYRLTSDQVKGYLQSSVSIIEKLSGEFGLIAVFPHNKFCNQNYCNIMTDGNSLYHDRHHLSAYGAKIVATSVKNTF